MTLSGGFGVCGTRNGAFWRRPGCPHCTQAGRDAATTVVSLSGWETDRSLSGGWTWTAADRRRGTARGVFESLRHRFAIFVIPAKAGNALSNTPRAVPLLWGGFLAARKYVWSSRWSGCRARTGSPWGVAVWDFFCCLLAFLLFGVIVHYNTRSPTTAGWAPPATLAKWS